MSRSPWLRLELGAELPDVHAQIVDLCHRRRSPDQSEELLVPNHAPRAAYHYLEYFVFVWRQAHLFVPPPYRVSSSIEIDVATAVCACDRLTRTLECTQSDANARKNLAGSEWFGDI